MDNDFKSIIEKFQEINKKGYVQGINNNIYNSAGLTLEHLLGKKSDSMFFPDYFGIEVKCTQRFSRYNISLFSLSFDGPELFESNYLLEQYGKTHSTLAKKDLVVSLKINEKVLVYDQYYFELKIDYDNKKIFIRIYNIMHEFIEDRAFIYFDSIEQRLLLKLNKLALFYASKKKISDNLFFRYYRLECYQCKNIDAFIQGLEDGNIKAVLLLRFAKSGKDILKNKNKNIQFSIRKNNIESLFERVCSYEK